MRLQTREFMPLLDQTVARIDPDQARQFVQEILKATRIYVIGMGRSKLVIECFAMRLVHLNKRVHLAMDSTAPALEPGDLLLAISGSGETSVVVSVAKTAKAIGAKVIAISGCPGSDLGQISDLMMVIPVKEIMSRSFNSLEFFPMGSLFELSALIFFELCVHELMVKTELEETQMKKRHINLF